MAYAFPVWAVVAFVVLFIATWAWRRLWLKEFGSVSMAAGAWAILTGFVTAVAWPVSLPVLAASYLMKTPK